MKKILLIILLALSGALLNAQDLSWKGIRLPEKPLVFQDSLKIQTTRLPFSVSSTFLPEYVRENPSGYSYLCRLELKIEDRLPLAMWLRLGQIPGLNTVSGGQANINLKLIRF